MFEHLDTLKKNKSKPKALLLFTFVSFWTDGHIKNLLQFLGRYFFKAASNKTTFILAVFITCPATILYFDIEMIICRCRNDAEKCKSLINKLL